MEQLFTQWKIKILFPFYQSLKSIISFFQIGSDWCEISNEPDLCLDFAYLGEIVSGQSRGFKRNLEKGQGILFIASEEMVESNQIIRSG